MEAISRTAHGIDNRTPQANKILPANAKNVSPGKGVFLIHSADGKHHKVSSSSRTLRVLPKPTPNGELYNVIQTLDGGVWETIFTSPWGFDISIVSEDS